MQLASSIVCNSHGESVMFFTVDIMFMGGEDTVVLSPMALSGCVDLMASFDDLLEVPELVELTVNGSLLMNNETVTPSVLNITVMDVNGKEFQLVPAP